jgi:RNA polymerase primary sigma factor
MARRSTKSRPSVSSTREDSLLSRYFEDISDAKPLSSQEEAELSVRIRKGDSEALEKLVRANLRFVVSVSRAYQNQGVPLTDLINEGNIGLIRAAKRFDERKNFRFISYAVWWIRQAILQALAHQSRIVRLPLNRVGSIHQIGKAGTRLEQRLQRRPQLQEIAREIDLPHSDVEHLTRIGARHASLDAPLAEGNAKMLHETVPCEENSHVDDAVEQRVLSGEIEKCLHRLPDRERDVLRLYFGIGQDTEHTLDEIGTRFGLTRERVRQIKQRALDRFRDVAESQGLRSYS